MADPVPLLTSAPNNKNCAHKRFTSRGYADAVNAHASTTINKSLYPGHNYIDLANFLLQPYQTYAPLVGSSHKEEPPKTGKTKKFAAFVDIRDNGTPQLRYLQSPKDLETSVCDDDRFNEQTQSAYGTLLFLRGYARPEWLNAVGARCSVDPEFFVRHLSLFFQSTHSNYFTSPALPSGSTSMLRLCVTTIGSRGPHRKHGKNLVQRDIQSLRCRAENSLREHFEGVSRSSDNDLKLGDSMVRHFSVHDEEHFSLEQDISLCVTNSGNGWIGTIWSDVGNDLVKSLVGPWQDDDFKFDSWDISYLPTIQHASGIALRGYQSLSEMPDRNSSSQTMAQRKIPQSASLLHLGYTERTDYQAMACDPFHALNSLFCFVASSELQIINLIEEKLRNELDRAILDQQYHQDVSNILYHKQILKRHMTYLLQIRAFVEARGDPDWPKSTDPKLREQADSAAYYLLKNFQSLHERTQTLIGECDAGMMVRMNTLQIREAQSALKQAKVTAKLTKLAFFYVPLSFTTSLFGMNVIEFGLNASIKIWQWAVTSALLLVISFGFLNLEWRSFWHNFRTVSLPRPWTRHTLSSSDP